METLQRTANRGSVSTATTYEVANSCKFEKDNSERLQRAYGNIGTPTNADKFTLSIWLKRTELQPSGEDIFFCGNAGAVTTLFAFQNDVLKFRTNSGDTEIKTNRVFRDTNAWYHIVIAYDSTDSTEANRVKFYVNGVQETSLGTANYPTQNADSEMFETNMSHFVGSPDGSQTAPGYYTELYFLDGQVKQASDFGEFDSNSGIWKPIEYTGSFGDEGYYLDFENSSNLGLDVSGNSNSFFALYGISAADQATDTCTNNFCTLNPLVNFKYTTNGITEGGTVFGDNTGGGVGGAFGTMAVTAGKWYWEVKLTQQSSHYIGVSAIDDGDNVYASTDPQEENSTFRFNINAARREYVNSGSQGYGSLDEFTDFHSTGDIISIALNMDDNQISIYGNGTLQSGVANTTLYDAANKMVVPFHGTINDECQYNFGGYSVWTPSSAASDANGYGTFEYAPPSGYYALCTKNLAQYGG